MEINPCNAIIVEKLAIKPDNAPRKALTADTAERSITWKNSAELKRERKLTRLMTQAMTRRQQRR